MMEAEGHVPDVITYSALISACEKAGAGEVPFGVLYYIILYNYIKIAPSRRRLGPHIRLREGRRRGGAVPCIIYIILYYILKYIV